MNPFDKISLLLCIFLAFFGTTYVNKIYFQSAQTKVYVCECADDKLFHSLRCDECPVVTPIGIEEARKNGYIECPFCKGVSDELVYKNNHPLSFVISLGFSTLTFIFLHCVFSTLVYHRDQL